MPDTRTIRLRRIADDLEEDGWYAKANSIRAVADERDSLRAQVRDLKWQLLHAHRELGYAEADVLLASDK